METIDVMTVETTLSELIAALRQETEKKVSDEREAHILVAYTLSGVFGSDRLCSKSWH